MRVRNLVALGLHALRIGDVIAPLQRHLRASARIGANACADHRARGRSDRGTTATAHGCASLPASRRHPRSSPMAVLFAALRQQQHWLA